MARVVIAKYRFLIIRMKISYEALLRRSTIQELFMRQIMTSFRLLRNSGQVIPGDISIQDEEIMLRQILDGDVEDVKSCMEALIEDNLQK